MFRSEAQMAARVVNWLRELQWTVYQEVDGCDIVAVQQRRVWIIETKLRLGFDVLGQAQQRLRAAHWVSVGVPKARRGYHPLARRVCQMLGVGILEVGDYGIDEPIAARLWRRPPEVDGLLAKLEPEHQTHRAAGTPGGGSWSPFKRTCRNVVGFVKEHPGCSMKELVDGIEHHYAAAASARAHLAHWIEAGVVAGVRLERVGRKLFVHPAS